MTATEELIQLAFHEATDQTKRLPRLTDLRGGRDTMYVLGCSLLAWDRANRPKDALKITNSERVERYGMRYLPGIKVLLEYAELVQEILSEDSASESSKS